MALTIDYYLAPQSPWAYLGHARFAALARTAGARINVLPVDFGKVFAGSGGLPLGQRAPQRQAYRLVELKRTSDYLKLPMHIKPQYFPVSGDNAARLIITVGMHDGADAAMELTGAVLKACWAEQRNIADPATLAQLLAECGLSPQRLEQASSPVAQEHYELFTHKAIAADVFGAPSYVVDGEIFWGQDRLDYLERRLLRA
ncbi:MAG: 2-hydroxychromene-2-carboxylate isomerase [Burkholderiaceae bacterium]